MRATTPPEIEASLVGDYVVGSDEAKRKAFLRAFTELSTRINLLLALPIEKLERTALKRKLDQIGKT